jgi:hypothetical protein
MPQPGQTVHLMTWRDDLRVLRQLDPRERRELKLYATDDLRHLYRSNDDLIRLRDGIVDRAQLVAEIRWRVLWFRVGYGLMLFFSAMAGFEFRANLWK